MSTKINLETLYSNAAPYLSDPVSIKLFIDGFTENDVDKDELIDKLENKIKATEGPLHTDFRILLNTINQL